MNKKLKGRIIGLVGRSYLPKARKMLPPAQYKSCKIEEVRIPMPDGVKLCATISAPDLSGKWPVILMRQPYTVYDWMRGYLHRIFAEQGYAFVMVQVRGTTRSEGEFLAIQEDADGRAVLDWVGQQSWCDGNIATFGGSYVANTQWAIADYHHPMLKTMFIAMFGAESYNTFYHRGLFNLEVWAEWTAQMCKKNRDDYLFGGEAARVRENAIAAAPASALNESLGGGCDWYSDWIVNDKPDAYWNSGYWAHLPAIPEKVNIPICLLDGWHDIFLHIMLSSYKRLPQQVRDQSVFLIGPWHHGGEAGGDLNYPGNDIVGPFQVAAAIRWFDHIIKGKPYEYPIGGIHAYTIGEDRWEDWGQALPSDRAIRFYLDASTKDGKARGAVSELPERESMIRYDYDPRNPVPSRGGRLIANHNDPKGGPECSCVQSPVGERADVISFVSEPVKESVKISGRIQAHVFVSSDAPATAFTVKISEVMPDGRAYNIRDDYTDIRWAKPEEGFTDYRPSEVRELSFDMEDICWRLKAGSRLRIDVSSSSFPQFPAHKNTLQPWAEATEGVIAHQTIYTGGQYPSRVILPILDKGILK